MPQVDKSSQGEVVAAMRSPQGVFVGRRSPQDEVFVVGRESPHGGDCRRRQMGRSLSSKGEEFARQDRCDQNGELGLRSIPTRDFKPQIIKSGRVKTLLGWVSHPVCLNKRFLVNDSSINR